MHMCNSTRGSLHTSQISHLLKYPSLWLAILGLSSHFANVSFTTYWGHTGQQYLWKVATNLVCFGNLCTTKGPLGVYKPLIIVQYTWFCAYSWRHQGYEWGGPGLRERLGQRYLVKLIHTQCRTWNSIHKMSCILSKLQSITQTRLVLIPSCRSSIRTML